MYSCKCDHLRNKLCTANVTRDSVMQISISVMLERDFGGNTSIYECDKNILSIMVLAFNK